MTEPIIIDSDSGDSESLDALAEDRPPSDEDYQSSITLSSDDDEDDCEDDEEEDADNDDTKEEAANDEAAKEEADNTEPVADETATTAINGTSDKAAETSKAEKKKKKSPAKKKKKMSPDEKAAARAKRKRKKIHERRNIRKIVAEDKLGKDTVNAQKEEEERMKRLAERSQALSTAPNLKTLLTEPSPVENSSNKASVVELSSSDDDDDDCCIIDPDAPQPGDEKDDDPENSGIHVDDSKNIPDSQGRVLVNVGHPSSDPDVFLSPQVARAIKPHQIGGIRFLYDNLVESVQRFSGSQGFGCILAHSMGLGKTLQVVGFTDVFMKHTCAKTVLIIVPINTLQNWINEFDMWLPSKANIQGIPEDEVGSRTFPLHIINDVHKTVSSRAAVIEKWTRGGGVLLMGYEMFRLLATCKTKTRKRKANAGPELIDIDLEEKNSGLQYDMQQALLNPGPDMVICDEGHRIKNSHAGISKSLKEIHTKRRVVLTGYPLQNNLIEYWCMVDFVRPNFLGSKIEFSNMFERPIMNGQCADSTSQDVKLMRYRAHVLHSLLEGFVQRRNHKVLMKNLPPKEEWVLMIKMSEFQRKIYNLFMDNLQMDAESCIGGTNPLKAFAVACKIWNHPDVMQRFLDKTADTDLELDARDLASNSLTSDSPAGRGGAKKMKKSASENLLMKNNARDSPLSAILSERSAEISYDWVRPYFDDYIIDVIENSGKFALLFQIIEETLRLDEKLLVFSQSLMTLNLLERYLSQRNVPLPWLNEKWARNQTYFRLDGSTNASERERLINGFNSSDNKDICLFLLSTKAGCLGINLIGANRVVMLDASWNPCHDCQAVCRVYRYGQDKPCFIYRLVTDNTMERKIYDRQVSKQGMADRVVDEVQVQNLTKKENDQLLEYQDKELPSIDPTDIERRCFDPVLVKVITDNHSWITQNPFTHESLLIEAQDQKMTRKDKRLAKESYEREKKYSVTFSRQSYANYYQNKMPQAPPPVYRGPSLPPQMGRPPMPRPSMSTPQMRHSAPPFRYPAMQGGQTEIRPGVTLQMIRTKKDIVAPGAEARVIKQGELVTIIRTPKGTYIKLSDGKIFAVRNKSDAENFGIDTNEQSPATASAPDLLNTNPAMSNSQNSQSPIPNTQLSDLLTRGLTPRNIAPNMVGRRRPQQVAASSSGEDVYQSHSQLQASASNESTNSNNSNNNLLSDPLSSLMPNYTAGGMMPRVPAPGFDSNFFQSSAMAMGTGNMGLTIPGMSQHSSGGGALYQQAGGYQSQYDNPYNQPVFGAPPDMSSNSSFMDNPFLQHQPPQANGKAADDTVLPNLNNLLRMRTPLVLPPIDGPEPLTRDGSDSVTSLPSLTDSPLKPMFSLGADGSGNG